MPGMSGPDATEAIRALGVKCPIIGVTGNTLDMDGFSELWRAKIP